MIVTPQNITTAPINWAALPKNVQEEKENIPTYAKYYTKDAVIRETLNHIIQEINKTHAVKEPAKRTPKKRTAKGKAPLAPTKKKPRTPRKAKKATTTRLKAKPRKTKRATKPRVQVKIVKEKAPVTVKKLSLELQLIKSFAAMQGKNRRVITVRNFLSKIEQAKRNTNVPTQKSILTLVAKRMKEGLAKLDKGVDTLQNIKIEQELLQRCKDAVKNAKPRLQVQYLSGLKGKK